MIAHEQKHGTGTTDANTFRSTKAFLNFPCAHRTWMHAGHCAFVHGYDRSFHFTFAANERDPCGFVIDFGQLGWLKRFLDETFDHTLLLCPDDPCLYHFQLLEEKGAAKIVVLPYGVGMEGTAKFVCEYADTLIRKHTNDRAWIERVEVKEHERNSGIYINPKAVWAN